MASELQEEASREIFRLALEGDPASVEHLLASYGGYLRLLTCTRLDRRIQHRVSPSDIVQETLLEAHRDFANFNGAEIEQFTGWLRQILVHNISNAVGAHLLAAKRSVRRERSVAEISSTIDQSHQGLSALAANERRSPASEVDHQESLVNLSNALERLPEDYRTVIVLRHLDGQAFTDIAARMQRTAGATRMLWLRAIEQLRREMERPS